MFGCLAAKSLHRLAHQSSKDPLPEWKAYNSIICSLLNNSTRIFPVLCGESWKSQHRFPASLDAYVAFHLHSFLVSSCYGRFTLKANPFSYITPYITIFIAIKLPVNRTSNSLFLKEIFRIQINKRGIVLPTSSFLFVCLARKVLVEACQRGYVFLVVPPSSLLRLMLS